MSAQLNDIISDGTAKFQVVKVSTSKDLNEHNTNTEAHEDGIAGNASTATKLATPVSIGNTSFDGSESIEVQLAKSAETLGIYTPAQIIEMINNAGSGVRINQLTKANVTAPRTITIEITEDRGFKKVPVEILKFESGAVTTRTEYNFNNGEASDFIYDDDYIAFDGEMHPLTDTQNLAISSQSAMGDAYIASSDTIDMSLYKDVVFHFVTRNEAAVAGIALYDTSSSTPSINWIRYDGEAQTNSQLTANFKTGIALLDNSGSVAGTNWQNYEGDA